MAGDAETGVTIMRVVLALDAGPMLAREVRPIAPDEVSTDVERDLAAIGARLLLRVVDQMETGSAVEQVQDEALVTVAPRLTKDDGRIDWSLPAAILHNRVRGLQPWPLAHSWLGSLRVSVLRSEVPAEAGQTFGQPPGTIVQVAPNRLVVAAGAGTTLAILALQPEGRRAMTTRDFLAGHRPGAGAGFTSTPLA